MLGLTYHGDKALPEMIAEGGRREQSLTIPALPENLAAVQAFVDEMLSGLPCDPAAARWLRRCVPYELRTISVQTGLRWGMKWKCGT